MLTATDGADGLALARLEKPDLIILDLMLDGMHGFEVCRALRKESRVPIIMLTARGQERDGLSGLQAGAADYIVKPFSLKELLARVDVVLPRR